MHKRTLLCTGGACLDLIGTLAELNSTALANKDNLRALLKRVAELMVCVYVLC